MLLLFVKFNWLRFQRILKHSCGILHQLKKKFELTDSKQEINVMFCPAGGDKSPRKTFFPRGFSKTLGHAIVCFHAVKTPGEALLIPSGLSW